MLALVPFGCSTADLKGPPEQHTVPTGCGEVPLVACDAGASGPACNGPLPGGAQIGGPYALGCRAYFTAPDCSTLSRCSCTLDDGGAPAWLCGR
jgi:hypothetical protein